MTNGVRKSAKAGIWVILDSGRTIVLHLIPDSLQTRTEENQENSQNTMLHALHPKQLVGLESLFDQLTHSYQANKPEGRIGQHFSPPYPCYRLPEATCAEVVDSRDGECYQAPAD